MGLRYVTDEVPGITRIRSGRGFRYLSPHGDPVSSPRDAKRVHELVIPPAWSDVWISPYPNGHIQATGRDAKGRKQYIYHPEWRRIRDETKFHRMTTFGRSLPIIRESVDRDLQRTAVTKEHVLATIVRLLDKTAIRIGNWTYARTNDSYGITTLRADHVDVAGSTLRFQFTAKGGKEVSIAVRDRRVANMVRRLQDLPGQHLFRYRNGDGTFHPVDSADVNGYLQEMSRQDFTAKDFRTWTASVVTAEALAALGSADTVRDAKRKVNLAISEAARRLGNTKTVCRNSYVHPGILDAYADGWLIPTWVAAYGDETLPSLLSEETALLAVLENADALGNSFKQRAG